MRALIGILFIAFGVILFARTIGHIRIARRRQRRPPRPTVATVLPNQTAEWAAYIPDVQRLPDGALRFTAWSAPDPTKVVVDATPPT